LKIRNLIPEPLDLCEGVVGANPLEKVPPFFFDARCLETKPAPFGGHCVQ
jgi:hypothetical protein